MTGEPREDRREPGRSRGKRYEVHFSGELTADEQAALNRRRFKLIENAFSVFASEAGEDTAALDRADVLSWPETTYQVVRLTAKSPDDAREKVIDALGREPEHLSVRHSSRGLRAPN